MHILSVSSIFSLNRLHHFDDRKLASKVKVVYNYVVCHPLSTLISPHSLKKNTWFPAPNGIIINHNIFLQTVKKNTSIKENKKKKEVNCLQTIERDFMTWRLINYLLYDYFNPLPAQLSAKLRCLREKANLKELPSQFC